MNFNEISKKNVTYDIKSHKKSGRYYLPRKHKFRKTTGGSN